MVTHRTVILALTPEEASRAERTLDYIAGSGQLAHEAEALRALARLIAEARTEVDAPDSLRFGARRAGSTFHRQGNPQTLTLTESDLRAMLAHAYAVGAAATSDLVGTVTASK